MYRRCVVFSKSKGDNARWSEQKVNTRTEFSQDNYTRHVKKPAAALERPTRGHHLGAAERFTAGESFARFNTAPALYHPCLAVHLLNHCCWKGLCLMGSSQEHGCILSSPLME